MSIRLVDGYGAPVRLVIRGGSAMRKGTVIDLLGEPTRENGRVVEAMFKISGYRCRYLRKSGALPILTIEGKDLPLPYHLIVRSWTDSLEKGRDAVAAFLSGNTPARGVFRAAGLEPARWPGRFE